MNKEKLSKAISILIIIVLCAAGISRCASSNSMTLKEYAAQQASEQAK